MSVEYSDEVFQTALRTLEDQPRIVADTASRLRRSLLRQIRKRVSSEDLQGRKKYSLHDIALLLQDGAKSGLEFERKKAAGGSQGAEVPWNDTSAEALRHIRNADLEPVSKVTQLCEDLLVKLEEALRMCEQELPEVTDELVSENERIAQIPTAQDAGDSSRAYGGNDGLEKMREVLDRFDRAARGLDKAVAELDQRGADIKAYLLIESATEAAFQVSWKTPLQDGDFSAIAKLAKLRLTIERLEFALNEVDALPGAGSGARIPKK